MKFFKFLLTILFSAGLFSCGGTNKNVDPVVSTYYLIRHAEKDRSDSTNLDPELNQKGFDRAIRWADVFDKVELDAIYSTNYERTTMTAAPISVKKNLDVKFYDPSALDVAVLKAENEGNNVLIVGHSNTTPNLTNKLLGVEKYKAMDDTDNGSLFIVRIIDGEATDMRLKIN